MLSALRRALHTPLRLAMGNKKHTTAVVLLDKAQAVPDWLHVSKGAMEDLERQQSVWLYDESSGYNRVCVKRLKKKTYTEEPNSVFKSAYETVSALKGKKAANSDVYLPSSFTQGRTLCRSVGKVGKYSGIGRVFLL